MTSKKLDDYDWTKNRLKYLFDNVKDWKDDLVYTEYLGIWSMKKLIALDYYIEPFVKILRKNNFKKWVFVDPFAGSGLFKINDKFNFPGSPLIPLFRREQFHKYLLSDVNQKYINALNLRIKNFENIEILNNIEIKKIDCNKRINEIFSGSRPNNWKDIAYLVFLDSYGLDISWDNMARILNSGPVDIIFTFMTWGIVRNKNIIQSRPKLNKFFGDIHWQSLSKQDDFVEYYCKKIQKFGHYKKYKTYNIAIENLKGNRYDLILATQSEGGANVLNDLRKKIESINPKMIEGAFSVARGEQRQISEFY
ncbi:MAG: three-Cys-motif partner protein TcmP [Nitrososphaeraceae archaeon]|nr:three-Cys-motif partner protein TcmP [Nitrososphaeraceae archaeon]